MIPRNDRHSEHFFADSVTENNFALRLKHDHHIQDKTRLTKLRCSKIFLIMLQIAFYKMVILLFKFVIEICLRVILTRRL